MIYDLAKINEMADGDQDFVVSVVSVFVEEVPADLNALERALSGNDFDQIYKMAHKIKPNVDLLGMEQTRSVALDIETLGKNEANIDQIAEIFPQLKRDVEQVISELRKDFDL